MLRNVIIFLRFWFRLLTSYSSGSDFRQVTVQVQVQVQIPVPVPVLVPVPYLDHEKHSSGKKFVKKILSFCISFIKFIVKCE